MRRFIAAIAAAGFLSAAVRAQDKQAELPADKPLEKISAGQAVMHYQETMIVTGIVAQVSIREKLVLINLDKKYPESPFTGVIFARATNDFGNLKALEGAQVEFSGKIEPYHDKPQIVLNSTNQLKVIESAATPGKQ